MWRMQADFIWLYIFKENGGFELEENVKIPIWPECRTQTGIYFTLVQKVYWLH